MGGNKIWLGDLENMLIRQTAWKSGVISQLAQNEWRSMHHSLCMVEHKPLAQDEGAQTTHSGRWSMNHSLRPTEHKRAQGEGAWTTRSKWCGAAKVFAVSEWFAQYNVAQYHNQQFVLGKWTWALKQSLQLNVW